MRSSSKHNAHNQNNMTVNKPKLLKHKRPTILKLHFLTLSILTAITGHNAFANEITTNSTSLNNATSSQSSADYSDDMPSTTLEVIEVNVLASDASEESDEYVYYKPSTSTGLTLSPKQTPQSVTTVTRQQIKDKNLETLEDIINYTPGISEANLDGGKSGSAARGFEISQYSIDGQKVAYNMTWVSGEDRTSTVMYDRAEIVRGAAGLTTGSGRPSASINLIRKHATSRIPTAEVELNADHYGKYGAVIDASTPLSKNGDIRGRFVAEHQEGDTYIDRESKERTVLYSVIDADITDNTRISGGISYQDGTLNSAMWGSLPSYYSDGSKTDWDVGKNASVDWVKWATENLTYFGSVNHDFNDNWGLELKASRSETEGKSKLFYLYGHVVDKQTGLGLVEYNGRYDIERNIDAAEASINGSFDAINQTHEIRFGVSYNNNEEKGYDYTATPNLRPIGNFIEWDGSHPEPVWSNRDLKKDVTINEQSLFASARLQLSDPMALILGSRVTNYELSGDDFSVTDIDISHDEVWVPYIGTTYDINDNHTLFASYTSIFQPQREKDINNNYLDPIEGNSYELGIKSSNDDETLQTQFSVFRIEQDKLAQKDGQKMIAGTMPPEQAYIEAGGATSTGIDVEVSGMLSPNWQGIIGYTQFKAEDAQNIRINSEHPDSLIKIFTTYDASNLVPGLTVGAGLNWSGDRYAMVLNPVSGQEQRYDMEDKALVSLMAHYEMNENLDLQLNVDNLFDEKYIEGIAFNQLYYGEPLSVSGKLTYKF